jgi:hypothetical protein
LLGQKKYTEAETLLLEGYKGMKVREKLAPPQAMARIPETVDRLVALYQALGKPQEMARWRKERERYPPPLPPPQK